MGVTPENNGGLDVMITIYIYIYSGHRLKPHVSKLCTYIHIYIYSYINVFTYVLTYESRTLICTAD